SGAEAGYFRSDGSIIARLGMTEEEADAVESAVRTASGRRVIALGGRPPRSGIVAELEGTDSAIILVGGPFTPVFGTDEQAWLQHYAALVSTGLDRVRLVGELETTVTEVTERTRQLEAANKELEAFSYSVSHDLRAPLRAISGYSSVLLEDYAGALPEEGLGYLKRVKENGDHMGHLIDDLLAFSRLGRQALRAQRVHTRAVVDRALAQLAPAVGERRVEVVIGDLPDCDSDPALLEQVFVNLLGNAIKYSRKQEGARIVVGATQDEASAGPIFFVKDNGAGFDMRYVDKLFGVFQRLHRSEDYEGTGVGL